MKIAKKEAVRGEDGKFAGVRFTFNDMNETVRELTFADLHGDVLNAALAHGFLQKLGDSYANAKGNAAAGLGMFDEVFDQIKGGSWNKGRTGTGGIAMAHLVAALVEVTGKDEDTVKATLADKTKEEIAAIRKHKTILPVIKRLELEKAEAEAEGEDEELEF